MTTYRDVSLLGKEIPNYFPPEGLIMYFFSLLGQNKLQTTTMYQLKMIQASTVMLFGALMEMANTKLTFDQIGAVTNTVLLNLWWLMSLSMDLDFGMNNKGLIGMTMFGLIGITWTVDLNMLTRNVTIVKLTMFHMITKVSCIILEILIVNMVIACILR